MRRVNVIGIGSGDPDDITVRAVRALNRSDVLFFAAKGADGGALLQARYEICRRYVERADCRIVEIADPERDLASPRYGAAVERWYDRRIAAWEDGLRTHLADGEVGGFLVWGDPALYDGTLRVLEGVRRRGDLDFEIDVIPGISAIQVLAARHKITLNQVGRSVLVTTGRELAERWAGGVDDVVVMLDPHCSFQRLDDQETLIYWGAYLGTPDEILVSGTVGECGEHIARVRGRARDRHGWVFDTYLLRRAGRR